MKHETFSVPMRTVRVFRVFLFDDGVRVPVSLPREREAEAILDLAGLLLGHPDAEYCVHPCLAYAN